MLIFEETKKKKIKFWVSKLDKKVSLFCLYQLKNYFLLDSSNEKYEGHSINEEKFFKYSFFQNFSININTALFGIDL